MDRTPHKSDRSSAIWWIALLAGITALLGIAMITCV